MCCALWALGACGEGVHCTAPSLRPLLPGVCARFCVQDVNRTYPNLHFFRGDALEVRRGWALVSLLVGSKCSSVP